jgi:NAD(P)H-flavin reductase
VLTGCLDPENFKEFKLVKRTQLSHNVAKFKFELPAPTAVLGLPIGQHISCRFGSVSLHSRSSTSFLFFLTL